MDFDLFIIESLDRKNEKEDMYEGKFIETYLKLINCKKTQPKYIYIRTEQELEKIAQEFCKCGYDNLFISCHGGENSIHTTYNKIDFARFAEIFEGKLNGKRIFVSACLPGKGNKEFSDALYKTNQKMLSFISPAENVYFKSTYAFWTTFFYIFSWKESFNVATINNILNICSHLFCIKFYWDGPISGKREQRKYGSRSFAKVDLEGHEVIASLSSVKKAIIEGMR